jgi:four helix bundle protein
VKQHTASDARRENGPSAVFYGKANAAKQSFRDLRVWKKSMELAGAAYRLTRGFPREEAFGLSSQLRRSAISIPSNIAEGHGRMNAREFKHFLLIARGSNSELQTQLQLAVDLEFASSKEAEAAQVLSEEVENMLFAFLGKLRSNST